jgi:hypothetical protein
MNVWMDDKDFGTFFVGFPDLSGWNRVIFRQSNQFAGNQTVNPW